MFPSVNSQELFKLHQDWFVAKSEDKKVKMREILLKLRGQNLHPENVYGTPKERIAELLKLENLRLNHQYYLSRVSNYTLIGPKIPGGLSETSVSLLRGSKGRGRKGQSGGNNSTVNDLANNEEVKEAARMFNQIDLVVCGEIVRRGSRQLLKINEQKTDIRFLEQLNGVQKRVTNQFSSNASSIQPLEEKNGTLFHVPNDLGVTVGKSSDRELQRIVFKIMDGLPMGWNRDRKSFERDDPWPWFGYGNTSCPPDGLYIQIGTGQKKVKHTDKQWFRICMERPHFNLGNKKPAGFRSMVESGINFVSRHIDAAGRPAIAFCYLKLEPDEAKKLIAKADKPETKKYQWQPYLFHDNTRSKLYTGNNSLKDMGAKLLLYLVENKSSKLEIIYSAIDEGTSGELLRETKIEKMLCEVGSHVSFPLTHQQKFKVAKHELDYSNDVHRRTLLLHHCGRVATYARKSRKWTDLTNTARSVLSGKDGEQLAALYSGLKGDRSMARGDDLIEKDDSPSEVKHISGAKGDAAFTIDPSGTIHLGGPGDITSQKRLFVSWMEDKGVPGNSKLHMKLLITDKIMKGILNAQHDVYYGTGNVSKRAGRSLDKNAQYKHDLQYHSQPYETSKIGKGNRRDMPNNGVLDFSKNIAFEYIEGETKFSVYSNTLVTF